MRSDVAARTGVTDAVVSITAHVPEDAMSAGLLGTERVGHGVRIRADGLIATIGYVVHEAENLWIGARDTVVPGFVVGYDFDSGLALIKPSLPLQGPTMPLGSSASLIVGDARGDGSGTQGNMFVPVDGLMPILGDLLANGRASGPGKPWLGVNTDEVSKLLAEHLPQAVDAATPNGTVS